MGQRWLRTALVFLIGAYLGSFSHIVFRTFEEKACSETFFGPKSRIKTKISDPDPPSSTTATNDSLFPARHPICKLLPQPTPNALSIWMNSIPKIHAASELKPNENDKYYFHDYFAQLLAIVSSRLPQSIQSMPDDYKTVKRILDQAYKRWKAIQENRASNDEEPVKIVILGGSVLVGRNCRKIVKDLNIQAIRMPQKQCNYAHRLGIFLEQMFGPVVQVTNVAVGGTNSAVGAQIFEYDLLPPEAKQPDIVINAYSTNDMHVLTMLEAESSNTTLRERVFDITQDFVRAVMQKSCKTPLLLHFDDYLGNEQREILATTELSQGVQVLAHYYGFGSLSYANVVRPWVYGDTKEFWFSPEGWWENGEMAREIHPGMGMHMISTWVISFALLHITTSFCSVEHLIDSSLQYDTSFMASHIPLKGWYDKIPGKPKPPPNGLPPRLTKNLSLATISQDWGSVHDDRVSCEGARCPFSWLAGMSNQQNDKTWIVEHFAEHETTSEWDLTDDGGKLGWVPSKQGASMILEVSDTSLISVVTVFFLKSYGEKWQDSAAKVDIEDVTSGSSLGSLTLKGVHNKETSEMYTESLTLSKPSKSIRFKIQLVGGTTFKMMGLAICK